MNQNNRAAILGGIIAVGVVVAFFAIFLSTRSAVGQGARFDYDSIPQTRTADGAFVLGDPEAPITVVEFADFMCPHCQDYTSVVDQVIEEKVLAGEAQFEFRFFPTSSSGQNFMPFRLVECATEQDANIFWAAHDVMFDLTKRGWNQTASQEFADELGLNYGELLNCAPDADQYLIDARVGDRAGISGTPGIRIRINGGDLQPISPEYVRGGPSYSVLAAAIDAANQ